MFRTQTLPELELGTVGAPLLADDAPFEADDDASRPKIGEDLIDWRSGPRADGRKREDDDDFAEEEDGEVDEFEDFDDDAELVEEEEGDDEEFDDGAEGDDFDEDEVDEEE